MSDKGFPLLLSYKSRACKPAFAYKLSILRHFAHDYRSGRYIRIQRPSIEHL